MAKSVGSEAKSSSRRCFTRVKVTTPIVPKTPLPTKFAAAEKHMLGLPQWWSVIKLTLRITNRDCNLAALRLQKLLPVRFRCDMGCGLFVELVEIGALCGQLADQDAGDGADVNGELLTHVIDGKLRDLARALLLRYLAWAFRLRAAAGDMQSCRLDRKHFVDAG